MSEKQELQKRFEAERKNLEAKIADLEANAESRKNEAIDAAHSSVDELRSRLDEMKQAVADGWESLTEEGAKRVNALLGRVKSTGEGGDNRTQR